MPGFDNGCVYFENGIDPRGTPPVINQMSDGKLLIGSNVAPYVICNNITSSDSTVTITNGPGTIDLKSGASVPTTFVAEDASTATPALNILNIVGTSTNGIDTTAIGNTVTVGMGSALYKDFSFNNLAPATQRVLGVINTDTNAASFSELLLSVPPLGADAMVTWEIQATGFYSVGVDNSDSDKWKLTNSSNPSSGDALISTTNTGVITLFNDLDVTEGGTGVSTLTSHGILMGNGAGDINATAEPSNGQILIGSTGNFPTLGTISGTGITVTNGAGTIALSVTTGGMAWTDATNASYNLSASNGYVTNRGGGVTYTLPASGVQGDTIKIVGKTGLWSIAQNANQQICVGSSATSVGVGGSLTATNAGDCVELICITAGASTVWRTDGGWGNLTVV